VIAPALTASPPSRWRRPAASPCHRAVGHPDAPEGSHSYNYRGLSAPRNPTPQLPCPTTAAAGRPAGAHPATASAPDEVGSPVEDRQRLPPADPLRDHRSGHRRTRGNRSGSPAIMTQPPRRSPSTASGNGYGLTRRSRVGHAPLLTIVASAGDRASANSAGAPGSRVPLRHYGSRHSAEGPDVLGHEVGDCRLNRSANPASPIGVEPGPSTDARTGARCPSPSRHGLPPAPAGPTRSTSNWRPRALRRALAWDTRTSGAVRDFEIHTHPEVLLIINACVSPTSRPSSPRRRCTRRRRARPLR
jgi:hypothetical protein